MSYFYSTSPYLSYTLSLFYEQLANYPIKGAQSLKLPRILESWPCPTIPDILLQPACSSIPSIKIIVFNHLLLKSHPSHSSNLNFFSCVLSIPIYLSYFSCQLCNIYNISLSSRTVYNILIQKTKERQSILSKGCPEGHPEELIVFPMFST